mgnify:CR=1 FL=1
MDEALVREIIRQELSSLLKSDRFTFEKTIQILDGRNIQLGKGTGTKIGTETSQKIGFLGSTPIIQWVSGTGRQDISGNTGVAANVGFQANGNTGSIYYSLGDVVAALKAFGLLG